ncbi:hypothetical protein SLS58_005495 [Diplodia intermedia]|uniref:Azaphilone pigments biosynthesis cluster protein L N-terminal domain-containing protein n=1 Tax=Diplodia intermedia TaxID=856260 RepID=A0ABR3TQV1_9PEZI
MEPVSASVGLVASLATLVEVSIKSYTALSKFIRQMKNAPDNVRELCRKVKRLEEVLSAVHQFVHHMRDDELPPNLRSWWESNMDSITTDLRKLGQRAEQLNALHAQSASSRSKLSARLKTVGSGDEVARYERSIESNIKELDRIRGYLDRAFQQVSKKVELR